ncbi:hypothetical protein [Moorena sp. SIO4G3]|uniref:hypothetical protein n=1 Tax=Moorena sp. SIO4G3 TaxID=2607821 RepID=UPI00142C7F36|nr:hypothetical protein [Moorena sp. SIO4G3]NEO78250.1 hypothetical protein [Moorena sp. SIO4G3]
MAYGHAGRVRFLKTLSTELRLAYGHAGRVRSPKTVGTKGEQVKVVEDMNYQNIREG